MNVNIRIANISDMNQLAICNKNNLPIYYEAGEFLFYLLSSKISIIVAEIDDDIIGYIMGKISNGNNGNNDNIHILSFGVDKEYRKQGIGTNLLESFMKLNCDKCKTISLYVYVDNKVAINFYKKNGFTIIKRIPNYYNGTYDIDNCDAFQMVYNMPNS